MNVVSQIVHSDWFSLVVDIAGIVSAIYAFRTKQDTTRLINQKGNHNRGVHSNHQQITGNNNNMSGNGDIKNG